VKQNRSNFLGPDRVLLVPVARLGHALDVLADAREPEGPLGETEGVARVTTEVKVVCEVGGVEGPVCVEAERKG
jgi:hypothetical protein